MVGVAKSIRIHWVGTAIRIYMYTAMFILSFFTNTHVVFVTVMRSGSAGPLRCQQFGRYRRHLKLIPYVDGQGWASEIMKQSSLTPYQKFISHFLTEEMDPMLSF